MTTTETPEAIRQRQIIAENIRTWRQERRSAWSQGHSAALDAKIAAVHSAAKVNLTQVRTVAAAQVKGRFL